MSVFLKEKTIKFFAKSLFCLFILIIIFVGGWAYTEAAESGCKNGEEACIQDCGFSSNGQCVVTTKEYKEDGKNITQVMEIPMVDGEDGRVTESYTDSEGEKFYRTGTVNTYEEVTYIGKWKTAEEAEADNTDTENTLESQYEDPDKYKNKTDDDNLHYTLLVPLPQEGGDLKEDVSLDDYLAWVYKFTLYLAAFLAVMQITIGGVMFIASGASEKTRSAAKDKIWNAIYGLILAFGAYLILYTINPQLVSISSKNLESVNVNTDNNENNDGEFEGGGGGEFGGDGTTGSW